MVYCQGQIETENGSVQTLWPPPPPPPPKKKKSYSPKLNKEKKLSEKRLKQTITFLVFCSKEHLKQLKQKCLKVCKTILISKGFLVLRKVDQTLN